MTDSPAHNRSDLDEAQRLLDGAIAHVLQHGYQDVSLRAMAEQLGTSHRMLIYYFGSADGFWQALLARLRRTQIDKLAQKSLQKQMPSIEEVWADLTSPPRLPLFRLMFQIYGKALGEPDRHQVFLRQVVGQWLESLTQSLIAQHELPPAQARAQARLRLAVMRGLLLDLLTTGDLKGTTQALRLFARSVDLDKNR
ncbi:TetR/AcrR family transcriptional regulator [Aquabacterium sp.]|uniref:TetR/AcrR family transcriptional regulator n=1 Tax=Aquabacterium sp. TaxID=1872578 RepID=UPI003D6CEB8A